MENPDRKVPAEKKRYGLIAGWGNYPIVLAQAIKEAGHEVVCLGVLGHVDPKLREICDVYRVMGLARFGAACRYFRKQGVTEATMAGKIFKKKLLQTGFIWRQLPDLYTLSVFFPHFLTKKTDLKDDSLLLTVTKAFEDKGIRLVAGTDLAPNLLVRRGILTRRTLTESDWDDIRLAWPLTREIGRLDFGQDVMVKNRTILAVEGIDGTDETMARAGRWNREKGEGDGFAVVKIGKPNQDMRFDVPTIGFGTLEMMAASGANVLAVEAGKTLCVEPQDQLAEKADSMGIAVVALDESDLTSPRFPLMGGTSADETRIKIAAESPTNLPRTEKRGESGGKRSPDADEISSDLKSLTSGRLTRSQQKDILFGWPIVEDLARFGVGRAVLVKERAVLTVESVEGELEAVRRTKNLVRNGFTILLNVVPSRPSKPLDRDFLIAMIETRANVLAVCENYPFVDKEEFVMLADELDLRVIEMTPKTSETSDVSPSPDRG